MKIDNEFTVSVPIDRAWAVLTDLQGIAPCMPGAQLTGVAGEVYSGKVKVKVGPISSEYAGTAQFTEKDEAAYRAVIDAKGRDARGAGNATAAITAQLRARGSSTVVSVSTDLRISGKIAQFGSGMIREVSAKLLGQFADCLEGKLAAGPADATAPAQAPAGRPPSSAQTQPAPASSPPAPAAAGSAQAAAGSRQAPGPATADGDPATQSAVGPAEAEPLDLMKLAGGSVYRRALPLAAVLVVVVAVIIYLIVR